MNSYYQPIERVKNITKEEFLINYYKKQKPLVIENFIEDWPAYKKWNLNYIKESAAEQIVPLYDDSPVDFSRKVNEPVARIKMSEYIDILEKGPTNLRIFLFNLIKKIPSLKEDFSFPKLGINFIREFPTLFFGGEGSKVFMHYDIDLANIFHFHFHGKKECRLFSPSDGKYLYKIPHSLIAHEGIDFENIDFEKWPALKKAKGYIAELNHGETLYMPEGWWHHMKYITPGFSMSLRSLARNPMHLCEAFYNLFIMRNFDNMMRKWGKKKWMEYKNKKAIENVK